MDADDRQKKHDAYARRADPATLVLAFVFLVVWSLRAIWTGMDPGLSRALFVVQGWIWLAFIADIVIRLVWSGNRWRWLWTHPIDLIAVFLPPARPLKILTVFTQGALLGGARRALKTSQAVLVSAVLLMWIGAVSALSFERGAEGANIVTFPDALWWSLVSVTTVGYGDFYPVTTEGRIVAMILMLVGISLIGV
ncbi:potassium channel family protein, partial [Demequina sp.]|uniref:potassium channel family protein n=1 Tax=Demequina sp. TaxID=2050685 RepID=UPI0025EB07D7